MTDEEIVREAWPGVTRDQLSFALHVAPAIRKAERERVAEMAEAEAERIKHTSHHDGLGMGHKAEENTLRWFASLIRADEEGKDG